MENQHCGVSAVHYSATAVQLDDILLALGHSRDRSLTYTDGRCCWYYTSEKRVHKCFPFQGGHVSSYPRKTPRSHYVIKLIRKTFASSIAEATPNIENKGDLTAYYALSDKVHILHRLRNEAMYTLNKIRPLGSSSLYVLA